MSNGGRHTFEVLLVEANDELAQLVGRVMARVFPEASLRYVYSVEQARQLLEKSIRPRLVLLSGQLASSLSGLAELGAFLASSLAKAMPVLLLDYEQSEDRVRAYYQAGVAAVHAKPETLGEWRLLLEQVRLFWFVYARTVAAK